MTLADKLEQLKSILACHDKVAVAFSGGVDSTLLLAVAAQALPQGHLLALTAAGPLFPPETIATSRALAQSLGAWHLVINCNPLEQENVAANPPLRCYYCKQALFKNLLEIAHKEGFPHLLDGSNFDDLSDYRPGRRALHELGITSPLQEAGLTKKEIRKLSRQYALSTADNPSQPCLATRFPYGTRITSKRLEQVQSCEAFLRKKGFGSFRVRHHGEIARIEVPLDETPLIMKDDIRIDLLAACKAAGFTYITLDLQGFRSGSMNETLQDEAT